MFEDLSTDIDGRSVMAIFSTLVLQIVSCTVRRSFLPLCRKHHSAYFRKHPQVVYFKALRLLLLRSHQTSLKRRSTAILHSSESLRIGSLMARRWLTFRLTSLLMNSSSHHHCLSSPAKARVVQARFRDDESEDCQ